MKFFVMLWNRDGQSVTPMVDEDGDVEMFSTFDEAEAAALYNDRAVALGYDIFQMGEGREIRALRMNEHLETLKQRRHWLEQLVKAAEYVGRKGLAAEYATERDALAWAIATVETPLQSCRCKWIGDNPNHQDATECPIHRNP